LGGGGGVGMVLLPVALGFLGRSTVDERLASITAVNKTQICQMCLLNWRRKEMERNTP